MANSNNAKQVRETIALKNAHPDQNIIERIDAILTNRVNSEKEFTEIVGEAFYSFAAHGRSEAINALFVKSTQIDKDAIRGRFHNLVTDKFTVGGVKGKDKDGNTVWVEKPKNWYGIRTQDTIRDGKVVATAGFYLVPLRDKVGEDGKVIAKAPEWMDETTRKNINATREAIRQAGVKGCQFVWTTGMKTQADRTKVHLAPLTDRRIAASNAAKSAITKIAALGVVSIGELQTIMETLGVYHIGFGPKETKAIIAAIPTNETATPSEETPEETTETTVAPTATEETPVETTA